MLAFAIGDTYDSKDDLLSSGNVVVEFFAIPYSASYFHSALRNVVTLLVVAFHALCILCNWMVFIPGLVECVVIYTISADYLRFIDQCKGDKERFLKVV